MPKVPDASSVTRLRGIQSSAVTDPVKRSASYVPAQPGLLYSLRASDAGRGMFPAQSYLSNPVFCAYVNPRHRGYITGQAALPRITIDFGTNDFESNNFNYDFSDQDVTLPPGPNFDVYLLNGQNVVAISQVRIYSTADEQLFENTLISTTPEWVDATLTSAAANARIVRGDTDFPGVSTVVRFRNVPVVENVRIRFYQID
jgi:hypothetical protein